MVGIYRPHRGTTQLVAPHITRARLLEALEGVTELYTYNGTGFDLPVIEQHFGVPLHQHHRHQDLMHDCWKRKLKGGLKAVERTLGIHRDSEGIDGLAAMRLWDLHKKNCTESSRRFEAHAERCCDELEILLRYNREDCENLETLRLKLDAIPVVTRKPVRRSRARVQAVQAPRLGPLSTL